MKNRIFIIFFVILSMLLSSCGLYLAPKDSQVKNYVLNYDSVKAYLNKNTCKIGGTESKKVILVNNIAISEPFDLRGMYYMDSSDHIARYIEHRWIVSLSSMLDSLLLQDLGMSCINARFVQNDFLSNKDYVLNIKILKFSQKIDIHDSYMQIIATINLIDAQSHLIKNSKFINFKSKQSPDFEGYIQGSTKCIAFLINSINDMLGIFTW